MTGERVHYDRLVRSFFTSLAEPPERAWDAIAELGGYVSSGFPDAQYRSTAELVRWLCDEYNVPKVRVDGVGYCYGETGIVGHHQMPETDCGSTDHTDPGPNWDYFVSLIY